MAVPHATNDSYTCPPQNLRAGSNWVTAATQDNTAMVRTDPTNLLRQTVAWSVQVNLPCLRLAPPIRLVSGEVAFRIHGNAPQGFVVQTSTNLMHWSALATLVAGPDGSFGFLDNEASSVPTRFYRLQVP